MKAGVVFSFAVALVSTCTFSLSSEAKLEPISGSKTLAIAQKEIENGNAKLAASLLSHAICKDPADLKLRRLLVEALVKMGLSVRAASEMQALVKVGMRQPEDFTLLAEAYRFSGKFSSAIQNYQEALSREPNFVRAQSGMALAYMQAGAPKLGVQVLKQAIQMTNDLQARRDLRATLEQINEAEAVRLHASRPIASTQL